jgi:hypothetical protein
MNTRIPQGLPVSLILFTVYISGVFNQVDQKTGATELSCIDDISWIPSGKMSKKSQEYWKNVEK